MLMMTIAFLTLSKRLELSIEQNILEELEMRKAINEFDLEKIVGGIKC